MRVFLKIFLILFFILFSNQAKSKMAESFCNLFSKEVIERYTELELDANGYSKADYFPFDIKSSWNSDVINSRGNRGDWVIAEDKKGYWIVGTKMRANLYEDIKVFPGDRILKIDGIDVRAIKPAEGKDYISYDQVLDFLYPEDTEKKEVNLTIIDQNNIKKDIKLKLFEYSSREILIDFEIHAINNINIKNGEVEVFITRTASWDNTGLVDLAEKNWLGKEEDGTFIYNAGGCTYYEDEWNEMQIPSPGWGIIELNTTQLDLDKVNTVYDVILRSKKVEPDLEYDSYVTVSEVKKGVMTFKNPFHLKAFPFDKQTLSFQFVNKSLLFHKYSESFVFTDFLERNLSYFIEKANKENLVYGWTVSSYSLEHFLYSDPRYPEIDYQDGVEIKLEIQRNSQYYISKIIFPVLLILMICWSVFWIHPRELESKLTITIVCLLSLIAYNFVIEEDVPKLSYLTIMDYIILSSYVFAAIPNFLSILSYNLYKSKKKIKFNFLGKKQISIRFQDIDQYSKYLGPLTYLLLIVLIIVFSVKGNPYTALYLGWLR